MRQQLPDLTGTLRRQTREHVFQIGVGVMTVQLGRLDQTHHRGRTLAGPQRAREQPVVPANGDRPYLVLDVVVGVISVFRESSTKFPRPDLTSGSAAVRGIPKVFECGAGLDRLDEPSRPPPLAGPGVAGSVAVRY